MAMCVVVASTSGWRGAWCNCKAWAMNSTSTNPPGLSFTSHGPSPGNSRSMRARIASASAIAVLAFSGFESAARMAAAMRRASAGGPATTRARVSAMRSQLQASSA